MNALLISLKVLLWVNMPVWSGFFEIFKIILKIPITSFMNSRMEATITVNRVMIITVLFREYTRIMLCRNTFNLKCKKKGDGFISSSATIIHYPLLCLCNWVNKVSMFIAEYNTRDGENLKDWQSEYHRLQNCCQS